MTWTTKDAVKALGALQVDVSTARVSPEVVARLRAFLVEHGHRPTGLLRAARARGLTELSHQWLHRKLAHENPTTVADVWLVLELVEKLGGPPVRRCFQGGPKRWLPTVTLTGADQDAKAAPA